MGAEKHGAGAQPLPGPTPAGPGARRPRTSPAKLHRHRLEALRSLLALVESLARPEGPAAAARAPEQRSALAGPTWVQVAPEHNRLYLRLAGLLDDAEARAVARDAERAFARLRPGFSAIVDLSELGTVRPEAADALRALAAVLAAAGLRRLVRVGGSSPAETMVARALEGPYASRVARSVEEAELTLNGGMPQARSG